MMCYSGGTPIMGYVFAHMRVNNGFIMGTLASFSLHTNLPRNNLRHVGCM